MRVSSKRQRGSRLAVRELERFSPAHWAAAEQIDAEGSDLATPAAARGGR